MLYQTTQEHEAFRQKMRGFAESEVKPIAFMLDQNNEFPAEAVKKLGEMGCTIARVPDSRYRELLLGYYVEGLTWEQTAVEMGYSYQNVVQFLHPKALAQVGEIL